ncbi:MAG: iron-sulfur cluster assembly scaffold protein [Planctomycetaceae bacterium]
MSDDLYDDYILDHYESPYHRGRLAKPTFSHEDDNPLCGDQVHLELLVCDDGRVKEAWFDGHGCAISQSAASILSKEIEGKTLDELKAFQAADMLKLLRVRLTPSRQKCGLLSFKVLKTILYSLDEGRAGRASTNGSQAANGATLSGPPLSKGGEAVDG